MPAHPQQKSLSPNFRDWQRLMRKKNRVLVGQGLFIETLQKCVDEEKQRWISSVKLEKKTQLECERLKEEVRVAKEDSTELGKVNKKYWEHWRLDIEDAKGFWMEEARQHDEARKSGGEKDKQIAVLSEKIEELWGEEQRLLSWGGISDWDMGRAKWWRERVERMERQLEEAKNSSERLERQTKVRETEIEEAKKSSGEKDIKIVALSLENGCLRGEVDRLQKRAALRDTVLEQAKKSSEEKDLKISTLGGGLEYLAKEVIRLRKETAVSKTEKEEAKKSSEEKDIKILGLTAENERLEEDAEWLVVEAEANEEEIEEAEKSSEEKDVKIVGLSEENERFRAEVDRLQAQAAAGETEMEEAKKTGEKKGLKIAELRGVNEALEGIVERLYRQAEAKVEKMELQQQKWQATDTLCNQLCARVGRMNVEEREREEKEVLWFGEELTARDERIEELEEGVKVVQTRLAEALEKGRVMKAKIADLGEGGEWWECDEMDTDAVA